MKHSARHLALTLGVQPSTITRDIKKGRVSAEKNERGEWEIDASEIARAYPERITLDDAGNISAKPAMHDHANSNKPNAMADVLQAQLEAAERLLEERQQAIEDLRRDREDLRAERDRLLTVIEEQAAAVKQITDQRPRMADQDAAAPAPAPAPAERPKGWRGFLLRLAG